MERGTIWHFVVLVSCVLFLRATNGFSLFDSQTSFAQFQRWPANREGRIRVGLRFKTYAKTGLLLYADDEGDTQYLNGALRDGFLVLELSDGNEIFESSTEHRVNDLQWHWIWLEVTPGHAAYNVDNSTMAEYNLSTLALKSPVYVGGLPKSIDISLLTNIQVLFEARFLGCVQDVRYGNGSSTDAPASLAGSSGMSSECKDACKPLNPCRNRGVCVNKFAKAECLCAGTGYRGEICQEELQVVGIPTPYDRVIIDVPTGFVSRVGATSLLIRFRSADPDGVFFHTAYKGDYILLELTNGRVATSIDLGSGSVTLTTKNGGYADNQWHVVRLERLKRSLNFTVDSSDASNGETQGHFTRFSLPDSKTSFFLGGLPDSQLKSKSVSRRNFTGCLQELTFNDYELFSKLHAKANGIRARGTIVPKCPVKATSTQVFQLKSSPTVRTSYISSIANLSRFSNSTPSPRTDYTKNQSVLCDNKNSSCIESKNVFSTPLVKTTTSLVSSDSPCPPNTISCGSRLGGLPTAGPSRMTPSPASHHQDNEHHQANSQPSLFTDHPTTRPNGTTVETVIMRSENERKEKDLTLWFVLAAGIAIVAFLLAIAIIVKINSANRKKYEMKKSRYEPPASDSGSFLKSTSKRKDFV